MKSNSIDKIVNNITADVSRKTKAALEYAGQQISGDFAVMAYLALDSYYGEWKPDYYNRLYDKTGSLLNSYYKVNNRKGFVIKAGVKFDSSLMNHPRKGIPEEGILENFMFGIHGSPDVYESGVEYRGQMDKFYENYVDSNIPYKYFVQGMER